MKRNRALRLVLAATLALSMIGGGLASAAGPGLTFTESIIADATLISATLPEMDGRYVVFRNEFQLIPSDSDVFVHDLAEDTSAPTVDDAADQTDPDVSSDLVAYEDWTHGNADVHVYNITWGSVTEFATGAGNQERPRISNHYVIWYSSTSGSLWWRDYMGGTAHEIPSSTGADFWDIDGDTVVFTTGPSAGRSYLYEWKVGSISDPDPVYDFAGEFLSVRLHAGTVVWGQTNGVSYDAWSMSLSDGAAEAIAENQTYTEYQPDVFHDGVAWDHLAAGNPNIAFGLLGQAGWSNVGVTADAESSPSLFGHRVVYERDTTFGDVYLATSTPSAVRTSGADRYQTAVEISEAYFDGAHSAVICTGLNFPDALAAAPFARFLEAPLLLVPGTSVPAGVLAELTRLGVSNVFIVGGESAVSAGVRTTLEDDGYSVERIDGVDRYETARKLADRLYDGLMADDRPWYGYAFVARGDSYADALSVAPVAASVYAPVLLTRSTSLPQPTTDALTFLPIRSAVVIGGTTAISDSVKDQIEVITDTHAGTPAERWQGPDRYATAVSVANNGLSLNWIDLDTLGLATGANFPDALGGGAALASYGSPVLLVKQNEVPASVEAFLGQREWEIGRLDVFGGTTVVSDGVKDSVAGHLR